MDNLLNKVTMYINYGPCVGGNELLIEMTFSLEDNLLIGASHLSHRSLPKKCNMLVKVKCMAELHHMDLRGTLICHTYVR